MNLGGGRLTSHNFFKGMLEFIFPWGGLILTWELDMEDSVWSVFESFWYFGFEHLFPTCWRGNIKTKRFTNAYAKLAMSPAHQVHPYMSNGNIISVILPGFDRLIWLSSHLHIFTPLWPFVTLHQGEYQSRFHRRHVESQTTHHGTGHQSGASGCASVSKEFPEETLIWYCMVWFCEDVYKITIAGGNSNIFGIFTPIWGRFSIWLVFFQMGWFNHQLDQLQSAAFLKLTPDMF